VEKAHFSRLNSFLPGVLFLEWNQTFGTSCSPRLTAHYCSPAPTEAQALWRPPASHTLPQGIPGECDNAAAW